MSKHVEVMELVARLKAAEETSFSPPWCARCR